MPKLRIKRSSSDSNTKKKASKLSESTKLARACNHSGYKCTDKGTHMLEILENYCKYHVLSAEPEVLRELLRATHKMLPKGPPKTKIRGILCYFTRTPIMGTWMKLARVLKVLADQNGVTTFVKPQKEIPFDRVVDSTTILTISANPRNEDRIKIMDTCIARIKENARKTEKISMLNN